MKTFKDYLQELSPETYTSYADKAFKDIHNKNLPLDKRRKRGRWTAKARYNTLKQNMKSKMNVEALDRPSWWDWKPPQGQKGTYVNKASEKVALEKKKSQSKSKRPSYWDWKPAEK